MVARSPPSRSPRDRRTMPYLILFVLILLLSLLASCFV
jgi:hypothetical protein